MLLFFQFKLWYFTLFLHENTWCMMNVFYLDASNDNP